MPVRWNPEISAGHVLTALSLIISTLVLVISVIVYAKDVETKTVINAHETRRLRELVNAQEAFRGQLLTELRQLNEKQASTNSTLAGILVRLDYLDQTNKTLKQAH